MNYTDKVSPEQLKKTKVWTILVESPEDCPRVYGFTSLNKTMSKAYDLVREYKEIWENDNEDTEFFEYFGNKTSPFKYSYSTCKEIIKESLLESYSWSIHYCESFHDYATWSITIEGHNE